MSFFRAVFSYFSPLLEGTDGKLSLKRAVACVFTYDFISTVHYSVRRWEAGRSLTELIGILQIESLLICGLLGLTSVVNYMERRLEKGEEK